AWEPCGRGVTINVFQPTVAALGRSRRAHLSRIAGHLAAAYRLRRKVRRPRRAEPEAVVESNGKIAHVTGPAEGAAARESLRRAVLEMEEARGELRNDPERAIERWRALVAARWSIVDEFEEGSRVYLVAYANELEVRGPEVLAPRERQVVTLAAAGRSTKLVAY